MSRNPQQQRLITIVEPVCQAAGYELVDLRLVLEQGGWTLRVAIDLPLDESTDVHEVPEDRVDLEDCENLSRELSAVLDVEDPIPQAFSLEVGSPGIDRPLRTAHHFQYFIGSEAKIQLITPMQLPAGERRNFKGTLRGVEDDQVAIDCDGQIFRIAINDIDQAKLVPDWDAVMRGKSGVGAPLAKPIKPGHRPSQKKTKPTGKSQGRGPGAPEEIEATRGGESGRNPEAQDIDQTALPSGSAADRAQVPAVDPGEPRDATRGGVNGSASPDQRGRERPLSIANKEQG